jgi:hypothetical protein
MEDEFRLGRGLSTSQEKLPNCPSLSTESTPRDMRQGSASAQRPVLWMERNHLDEFSNSWN